MKQRIIAVMEEINQIIRGKEDIIKKVCAAIYAGGHILLEDIPGVGKTTLALSISKVMDLDYKRIQFTPDVLPSDITGFSMYNNKTGEFEYKEGAAMTNLLLADEINRTSPKTQSALLEIMEEGKLTVDGITHTLPSPFIVIATENPAGSSGTQMLPESQLDRFMICTTLGYPCHSDAIDILKNDTKASLDKVSTVLTKENLAEIKKIVNEVYVKDSLYDYIVSLTEATRTNSMFSFGASPRASISLLNMGKAMSLINGRDYLTPHDVISVLPEVYGHRVKLSIQGKSKFADTTEALKELAKQIPIPELSEQNKA